jgi:hypothetical protein
VVVGWTRKLDEETRKPAVITGMHAKVEQAARSDGYRPICDPLWVWARLLGFPGAEEYRLVLAAARRLDTGHQQIQRVRDAIASMPPLESPAGRQRAHEVIGDAEMGVWAIDKAIEIALSLSGRYCVRAPMPEVMRAKQPLLTRLRDHYSHIDERALGRVKGEQDPTAVEAFQFPALLTDRILTDGRQSLDIDDETTTLCVAIRDYLVAVWTELVDRAHKAVAGGDHATLSR